jgi:hypothetical protein
MLWTKEKVVKLLQTNDIAVERAVLAIFNRQTTDEQASEVTRYCNHRGFRANHAKRGSYWARWLRSGNRLSGGHLALARRWMVQYHAQLCQIANEKTCSKCIAAPT